MSEETKPAEHSVSENPNSQAENDVKDVLAELKGEGSEKKDEDSKEAKEEAEIIAAANRIGQVSEAADESKESKDTAKGRDQAQRGGRGGHKGRVNFRENIKSDVTTLEETSDPVAIRKQVGSRVPRLAIGIFFFKINFSFLLV